MEKTMTQEESLELINKMIGSAKRSFIRMSFYFLLWGWLLFFAGLSEHILQMELEFEYFWIGWPIIMTFGGILAGIYGARESKKQQTQTYMDDVFKYVWIGFTVVMITTIVCSVMNRINPGPFVMLITALPTFVSGGVMRFKPLMLGGVIFLLAGIISFFFLEGYGSLIFCAAIIGGYIIPGYLLRNAEKKGEI
jgi:uncharacterized membrane protein HdeD (DUF308 family)